MTRDQLLARWKRAKEKEEQAAKRAERAKGALEQIRIRLRKEFGCKTVAEAQKLLAKLKKQQAGEEAELERFLDSFERDYGEALDE